MTSKQLKYEIRKLLEDVPDSVLEDLLEYLKVARKQTGGQAEMSKHLKRILKEDKELLKKLAE